VEDRSRHVIGVPNPTRVEEQVANLICDRIEPRLIPDLFVLPWRKVAVIAIVVHPSSLRPHYLKAQGASGGVYIRVGSTNRPADPAQVEELKRFARNETYDEQILPELNSKVIDFPVAAELFAPIRKLKLSDLSTLAIIKRHQNRDVPTVGGMILFGRNRLAVFPDAFIKAGRFDGVDRSCILDSADITSYPVRAVEEVLAFIQRNIRRSVTVAGLRNVETWDYPLVALREAITNAVVHSDYALRGTPIRVAIFDDRIEVDNPGTLPPGLTIAEIRQGISKLRNRVIARVFHELHLIEQWGSGIQRMTRACLEAGLPEPKLEEIGTGFRVTFSGVRIQPPRTDDLNQQILDALRRTPGLSVQKIADIIHRTTRATRDRLATLTDKRLITPIGSGPRDPRKVYYLMKR
jgi:predicted HTH transcriptional regulator